MFYGPILRAGPEAWIAPREDILKVFRIKWEEEIDMIVPFKYRNDANYVIMLLSRKDPDDVSLLFPVITFGFQYLSCKLRLEVY